jgi:cobalt/nickel transport system permease protein
MFIVALVFLVWAWRSVKLTLKKSFVPLVAVVSATLVVVQIFEFPVAGGGSTWHFMGGTFVTMVLGPYGAIISMTITLIIQALALGDGGITSFGANVFNMAVIGGLSFFVVKCLLNQSYSKKRLAVGLFVASWLSNVLTALAVGIEIGIYPLAGQIGGVLVTIPAMLVWYVPTGLIEASVTPLLILPLSRTNAVKLHGLEMLRKKPKTQNNIAQ